jgi:hypothetical protein|tara:strand:- start:1486 stop:2013 length:528 start_codon:yes stop_codon:yes gene_type:complete
MIKKITITILSLLIFVSTSVANACNFKMGQFGDSREKIKLEPPPISFPDEFGGEAILVPLEAVCKDDEDLFGTTIIYLYINKKLSQIRLERPLFNDARLMDFSMKKYGIFALPAGIKKIDWRGSNQWENNSERIIYIHTNIQGGSLELLEINSKLYEKDLITYFEKFGKWLDSQK